MSWFLTPGILTCAEPCAGSVAGDQESVFCAHSGCGRSIQDLHSVALEPCSLGQHTTEAVCFLSLPECDSWLSRETRRGAVPCCALKLSGLPDSLILSWETLTTAVLGVFLFFAMSFFFVVVGINQSHSVSLKTVCRS